MTDPNPLPKNWLHSKMALEESPRHPLQKNPVRRRPSLLPLLSCLQKRGVTSPPGGRLLLFHPDHRRRLKTGQHLNIYSLTRMTTTRLLPRPLPSRRQVPLTLKVGRVSVSGDVAARRDQRNCRPHVYVSLCICT